VVEAARVSNFKNNRRSVLNSSLSHVALLVPSVENSAEFLKLREIESERPETFESEGTKEVYVGSYETQSGLLLLLEAISDGPYKRALLKRGASLHHIAIDVLNLETFSQEAQRLGWKLHPVSKETMAYQTAWFFLKGVPTLIEVHQKRSLSQKAPKVTSLELPIHSDHKPLFEGIGLGEVVVRGESVVVTIDGHKLSFDQIACLK